MNLLTNMFTDRVFGSLLRFVFDRIFGNVFKTDINFNNIDLRNCHLKDLTFHADKINEKFFKQTPFRFFNGSIKNLKITLPQLSNLVNESIEITLDGLDLLLVFDSVDYSKVNQTAQEFKRKESSDSKEPADTGIEEQEKVEKEIDVYKKIINRILLNTKIRVSNLCIRILSDKPIRQGEELLLPQAPCLLLKVGSVNLRKILDPNAPAANTEDNAKDNMTQSLIFSKVNNYHIQIKQVSAHMLTSPQISADEFHDLSPSRGNPKAEFPFEYPTHAHPSTFLALGFGTKVNKKGSYPSTHTASSLDENDNVVGINAELILSSDRSKRIKLELPQIEIMLDFLVIKYMSRYVEKALEWQKANDYLNYKKQKHQNSEEYTSRRKSSEVILRPRGESGDNWQVSQNKTRSRKNSEMTPGLLQRASYSGKGKKVTIAGCDMDFDYFQSLSKATNDDELLIKEMEYEHEPKQTQAQEKEAAAVDLNVDLCKSAFVDELKRKGMSVENLNQVPDLADNLLDSSNIKIDVEVAGVYIYVLKTASTFLRTEFKRRWLFDELGSRSNFHKFNTKIPVDYFLLKLTHITLSGQKVENHVDASLIFANLKILDVLKVDRPLRSQSSPVRTMGTSNLAMSSNELFHSIIPSSSLFEQSMKLSKRFARPTSINSQASNHSSQPESQPKSALGKSVLDGSSMLFLSATESITAEFLQIRRKEAKRMVDFELDGTREHFCVNYLFKFNTHANSYRKQCRIQDQKNLAYAIYQPFNSTAFENHQFFEHRRPTIEFSIKTGEISLNADLPSFYSSFYMKIILDVVNILHNSSDGYFIIEKQYQDFRQGVWEKWRAENNTDNAVDPKELEERSKIQKATIDLALEEYYKSLVPSKIQALVKFHFGRLIFLGEHECDLSNRPQSENSFKMKSFEGSIAQFFEESQGAESSWESMTIFSKKALILDIAKTMVKLRKGFEESDMRGVTSEDYESTKGRENVRAQVLLDEISLFYPSEIIAESKKIHMSKLFSLSSKNRKIGDDTLEVLPSITFRTVKPRDEDQEDINLHDNHDSKYTRVDEVEVDKEEESKGEAPEGKPSNTFAKSDTSHIKWLNNQPEEITQLINDFKGHKLPGSNKEQYFKTCEGLATRQIAFTVPLVEVYLSNHAINFCTELVTKSMWYFEQIDEQLKSVLLEEANFFQDLLSDDQPLKNANKTQAVTFLSCKISDFNMLLFEPQAPKVVIKYLPGGGARGWADTVMRLDESVLDRSINTLQKAPIKIYEEANLIFEPKEYDLATKNFMCISVRDLQTVVFNYPSVQFQILHVDINNAFISDKLQLQPQYGSHLISQSNRGIRPSARDLKSFDFDDKYDQQILLYKQGNMDRKKFSGVCQVQELEILNDLKLTNAHKLPNFHLIPHDYTVFENGPNNIFSFAALIAQDKSNPKASKVIDASLRVSQVTLRSDLNLQFIDKLKTILKIAPESICKKDNKVASTEGTDSAPNSKDALDKKPKALVPKITLDFELSDLMIDIMPYINYDYYLAAAGRKLLKERYSELDPQSKEDVYYSNYRMILALKALNFKAKKSIKGVIIEELSVTHLDCFLKNSRQQNAKKNPIVLRSNRVDVSLFDNSFDELRSGFDFLSNPFRLSEVSLAYSQQPYGLLETSMKSIEIILCTDTILTLNRFSDLVKYQLDESAKRRNAIQKHEIHSAVLPQTTSKQMVEGNINMGVINEGNEHKGRKFKNEMKISEDPEIDLDFYKPRQKPLQVIEEDEDGFAVIEDDKVGNSSVISQQEKGDELLSSTRLSEIGSQVASSYKSQSSFISSNTLRFDEENMHDFVLEQQKTALKIELKLESLQVKLMNGRDFESEKLSNRGLDERLEDEIKEVSFGPKIEEERGGIMFSVENLVLSTYIMEENPDLRTNALFRLAVSCEQLEILDIFDKRLSNINKILTKYVRNQNLEKFKKDPVALRKYQHEKKTSIFNFLDVVIEVFSIRNSVCKDMRFFIGVHPIQININTYHYTFITRFSKELLEKNTEEVNPTEFVSGAYSSNAPSGRASVGSVPNEPKKDLKKVDKKKSDIFIPLAQVSSFEVYVNVNLEYSVFNLDGLKDAPFKFERLTLRAVDGANILSNLMEYYKKSATAQAKNVGNVLNLPIARNLSNLISATYNMVYLPYEHFKEDKGIAAGLREGVGGFAKSVASESLSFTEFMTNTIANVAGATGFVNPIESSRISRAFGTVRNYIDPDAQSSNQGKYKL